MSKRSEKLTAGLASIDDIRQRVELVAADFKSGKRKYASIDSWKLGELLGLDFDDTSDWSHHFLASRQELADSGFEHPFAENIRLGVTKSCPPWREPLKRIQIAPICRSPGRKPTSSGRPTQKTTQVRAT